MLKPTSVLLLPVLVLLALPLSGCGIVGGLAYAIKSTEKNQAAADSTEAPAAAPAPSQADPEPPPPPVAAPRDSIKVEQLP